MSVNSFSRADYNSVPPSLAVVNELPSRAEATSITFSHYVLEKSVEELPPRADRSSIDPSFFVVNELPPRADRSSIDSSFFVVNELPLRVDVTSVSPSGLVPLNTLRPVSPTEALPAAAEHQAKRVKVFAKDNGFTHSQRRALQELKAVAPDVFACDFESNFSIGPITEGSETGSSEAKTNSSD